MFERLRFLATLPLLGTGLPATVTPLGLEKSVIVSKCHFNRFVTVTGVTVSGEVCTGKREGGEKTQYFKHFKSNLFIIVWHLCLHISFC